MNKRLILAMIPLILVNSVAFAGQFAYIREHIQWIIIAQVAFALALESIALYLTFMAHEALMADDSAYGLRVLSYGFGALIGAMNYSHYSHGLRPTFAAVATGLFSISSPFLWGIYSRRASRDALRAKGLIEARAVKLGSLRWLLWFRESAGVFRLSVWRGENTPAQAITDWEYARDAKRSETAAIPQPERITLETARTKAEAVRAALAELGADLTARAVAEWLGERGWAVSPGHVRAIRAQATRTSGATVLALAPPAPAEGDQA
jgi:hypothetical protein